MTSTDVSSHPSFPHKEFTKIIGKPTVEAITTLRQEMFANAMSVPSTSGGGAHGLLGAVTTAPDYLTYSNQPIAFNSPIHPGDPPVPTNETAVQITNNNRAYENNLRTYTTYITLVNSLKQLLIGAVDDIYIASLKDQHMGYANISTLTMFTHLQTKYGTMKPAELEANRDRLKEKWNPDQPIEHFFNKVTQVRAIATRNGSAISDDATVTLCRSAFEGAGVYGQAILTWDTKALTDRTWTNFEPHFLLYEEARLEGLKTAKQAGFHGANHVLYTATGTPVLTPHTNPANNENTPPPLCHRCNNANATPPSQQQKAKPEFLYCWTHGLTKGKANHTSKNCTEPTEGHMKHATIYRRYGGSTSFDTLTNRTNRYQQSTNDGETRPAST